MDENLKNGGLPLSATALKVSLNQKLDTSQDPRMLTRYERDLLLQGEQEIDEILQENDEVIPFKYAITSYGADYPVDGLVQRIVAGDIVVPKFQRGYVWSLKEASRFVESLLLGLPVPSIFLSKEKDSQQLLVIDGQQRLLTLRYFYEGIWPLTRKEFSLKGVTSKFEGETYKSLSQDDKRRLNDSIIHAIIIRQEQPSDDDSSIYHIFERLNTSGVSLTPQEIRAAIYHGPFSDLLRDINLIGPWREIYGPVNKIMRDQELILRFLALFFDASEYSRPMKGFLNSFMGKHRKLNRIGAEQMTSAFVPTIQAIYDSVGNRAFRLARVLNAAVFDAVMVGVARRLSSGPITDYPTLKARYLDLLSNNAFLAVAAKATADEDSIAKRLALATKAFANIA
jgi:Protein of unknown function DUF262